MGRHDADPAGGRRYTGVVLLSLLIVIMIVVAIFALRALSHA
jgi:hypothetical protein